MNIIKTIKMEALKKDLTLTEISVRLGISRENMYHHIKKGNPKVLREIEKILSLRKGTLTK